MTRTLSLLIAFSMVLPATNAFADASGAISYQSYQHPVTGLHLVADDGSKSTLYTIETDRDHEIQWVRELKRRFGTDITFAINSKRDQIAAELTPNDTVLGADQP